MHQIVDGKTGGGGVVKVGVGVGLNYYCQCHLYCVAMLTDMLVELIFSPQNDTFLPFKLTFLPFKLTLSYPSN